MEIRSVAVGTWFPRTTLHLDEVEAALRGVRLPHHPKDLPGLLKKVGATRVTVEEGAFRTLRAHAAGNITLSLTEDGILLLETTAENLAATRAKLTRFYEDAAGPAMAALFRRGMPLPKELADVKEVLPFFVVATGGTLAEARALARGPGSASGLRRGGQGSSAATLAQLTLLPGRAVTVLHLPVGAAERSLPLPLEDVMRYLTFFREFEEQLHTYGSTATSGSPLTLSARRSTSGTATSPASATAWADSGRPLALSARASTRWAMCSPRDRSTSTRSTSSSRSTRCA